MAGLGRLLRGPLVVIEDDAAEELASSQDAIDTINALLVTAEGYARQYTPAHTEKDKVVTSPARVVDDKAVGYIGSNSSIWHILEFGSVNNPPYRPLTRAVESVGLVVVPSE